MVEKPYKEIIYEKKPPVAYVTFNRPEKMNSFSALIQDEIKDALTDAGWQDKDIRVIVIKGAGRCFSTGYDVSDAGERDAVGMLEMVMDGMANPQAYWTVFWDNPKPIIAQVHSFCLAGALAMASVCDLCICSEDALFGYPWIRNGGPEVAALCPWLLGMRKAKELMFTGNLISAEEAHRLGLVNHVVPRDKLDEEVNKMARTIAKVPVMANKYSKKVLNMAYELMGIRQVIERSYELEAIINGSRNSVPEELEFEKLVKEQGLKAALKWRSDRFAEEDAWWRGQKK